MDSETLAPLVIALSPHAQSLLAGAIVVMMFAIALGLRPTHFAFLKTRPLLFVGGLTAQLIALPIMTLILALAISPAPSIALGMIVVAACPGGAVSNFMSFAARGDTAYSVSLTAGSSVIAALWTPAAILFWSGLYPPTDQLLQSIDFDRASFIAQTTALLAAPLAAGMAAAHFRPGLAQYLQRPLAWLGASVLCYVIIRGLADHWSTLTNNWLIIIAPVAIHNAAAFALGAIAGRLLPANRAQRRALTFEVGIQNAGLAMVLLLAQLNSLGAAAAIAAAWGIWHFMSGGLMIAAYRFRDFQESRS